jgi:sugar-phosphatase
MIDLLGLTGRFLAIVTASDVGRGKPDPEPFRLAAERLSIPGDQCVAFEDAASGLISARAAGMYCVGVGPGVTVYRELADMWITDFRDPLLSELVLP